MAVQLYIVILLDTPAPGAILKVGSSVLEVSNEQNLRACDAIYLKMAAIDARVDGLVGSFRTTVRRPVPAAGFACHDVLASSVDD